jgi:hypothetical protein
MGFRHEDVVEEPEGLEVPARRMTSNSWGSAWPSGTRDAGYRRIQGALANLSYDFGEGNRPELISWDISEPNQFILNR